MKIIVTPIEEFIKDGMSKNEVAEDLNTLYSIINEVCNLNSHDYRCYATPKRELIIQFLTKTAKYTPESLIERIYDDTVIASHDIEDIRLLPYGEDDEIYLEEAAQFVDDEEISLNGFTSEEIISFHSLTFEGSIESFPFYKSIIVDITKIEDFSLSTLAVLLNRLSEDKEKHEKTHTIILEDRAIIQNTIDIFWKDISKTKDSEHLHFALNELSDYLSKDDSKSANIDENEAISEKKQKEKLLFLQYFLGAKSVPFSEKNIIYKSRYINIKFYLLLCFTYYQFSLLRKVERTEKMRKKKKWHINYINKILSGEKEIFDSRIITEYLKIQNEKFNPNNISQSDMDELKELITILENRPEYYSHTIAKAMTEMFGKSHRPLNRFLRMMGFKSIGNDTEV